jgi:hypothetical protein
MHGRIHDWHDFPDKRTHHDTGSAFFDLTASPKPTAEE